MRFIEVMWELSCNQCNGSFNQNFSRFPSWHHRQKCFRLLCETEDDHTMNIILLACCCSSDCCLVKYFAIIQADLTFATPVTGCKSAQTRNSSKTINLNVDLIITRWVSVIKPVVITSEWTRRYRVWQIRRHCFSG